MTSCENDHLFLANNTTIQILPISWRILATSVLRPYVSSSSGSRSPCANALGTELRTKCEERYSGTGRFSLGYPFETNGDDQSSCCLITLSVEKGIMLLT